MSESYKGTKFETVFEGKTVSHVSSNELLEWCSKFSKSGLAPKSGLSCAGNLSFRTFDGFVITAAGADLNDISEDDLVEVIGVDISARKVFAKGFKEPSSESFLHHEIYQRRYDVNAVFHGHDELIFKNNDKLSLPVTKEEQPYGSIALMFEVVKVLENLNYILIRNHGFLSFGNTMEEAGKQALKKHYDALKVSELLRK